MLRKLLIQQMENTVRRSYLKDKGLIGLVGDLIAQEERDKGYIDAFCKKFGVKLIRIDYTSENRRGELMYFFSDGFGGYTLEGVIGSLM